MNNVIQTYTGSCFNFADPDPSHVNISDIAHALSNMPRFSGHTRVFYSVAQHSVHVSALVPPSLKKAALLHDAAEAYMADIPTPLKALLPDYKRIYKQVEQVICERFQEYRIHDEKVKRADVVALATEKRDLLAPTDWWTVGEEPDLYKIEPMTPAEAKRLFMHHWRLCENDN